MTQDLNNQILTLLGRLALAKSIALNVQIQLQDLLDEHRSERVAYDENTLDILKRTLHDLDRSESTIDGAIYDIATELFKESVDQ